MTVYKDFVLLDAMSLIHTLTNQLQQLPDQKMRLKVCDAWVTYFASPYLYIPAENPIGMDTQRVLPVLCIDQKDSGGHYWRHRHYSGYKTGRPAKAPLLLSTRDYLYDLWTKADLPYLVQDGFEADDHVGQWVKGMMPGEKVAMVSVDSDWAQLVGPNVMWLDTFPPSRRTGESQKCNVLGHDEVLTRFNTQRAFSKHLLSNPYDLVEHKWVFGDRSDSLPGNKSVDRGIIDLLAPLESPDPMRADGYRCVPLSKVWSFPPLPHAATHYAFGVPDWMGRDGDRYDF